MLLKLYRSVSISRSKIVVEKYAAAGKSLQSATIQRRLYAGYCKRLDKGVVPLGAERADAPIERWRQFGNYLFVSMKLIQNSWL